MNKQHPFKGPHVLIIIVAALGYFVDIYDLVLFNVVKKESLLQLLPQANADTIKNTGIFLFNMQMTGMLIGGILWGIWGDKKGRLSVLFGSIMLYSAANLANAFVTDIPVYAVIRVIAGIGLAGELGAGITLVAETMSKENRGYGTMIIVTFGALGAVVAALVGAEGEVIGNILKNITGTHVANWQVAYIIGGTLGLLLLFLRIGTIESGMFKNIKKSEISKGDIRILFNNKERFFKYLNCILIGVPIWYIIGLLVANSQEIFAVELNIKGEVINGTALMYAYLGLSFGDLISGILSQWFRSRKKIVYLYLCFSLLLIIFFLFGLNGASSGEYYFTCFLLGTSAGYWAIFVTIASEQFGTNIRSTVTNTVPNFVRGSVPLITISFGLLLSTAGGNIGSAFLVGCIVLIVAFFSASKLKETFAKDLNYIETM
ncbi:Putative niacin/nicotinamide transporter NaiP [Flavobacteriales bacterium]|nr:putative sialic acid transporter [Flavobacteriales bacterium]MCL4816959.1 MFS transporter [Flavobacteriales bacterium]WKZ76019.1 MAG: MFS transporter [Vicingaceae bacterium]GIK70460.1 MAG: MFS transporter [Bacteroidota bacterium]CAG0980646.1 Putative niacin/nicotinamide transporter NaiP [Flavobacteriales bacterium]